VVVVELEESVSGFIWDIGKFPRGILIDSHSHPPLVVFSGPSADNPHITYFFLTKSAGQPQGDELG
jgi:hypothetical protein